MLRFIQFLIVAKAINCRGAKVPYLKGNFRIEGIPDGIEWQRKDGKAKKPCQYGQNNISKIMAVKENVKFVVIQDQKQDEAGLEEPDLVSKEVPSSILKLVDDDVVKRAFNGGAKIDEAEVDVMTLLRKEEYEELLEYSNYFSADAIDAVKKNFISIKKGALVATYTKDPQKFWLFYYNGNVTELAQLDGRQSVPGLWLDKVKGAKYKVLHDTVSIKSISIIKKSDKEIIAHRTFIDDQTYKVQVPVNFLTAIKKRLDELKN